jgi:hypothetical protein
MDNDKRNINEELEHDADKDANRDPLSGQTGAHPIGTGVGAATVGAVTTAIGAAAGPVGAAVGAVVGSVVGGLIGKGVAETVNPTVEDEYWRNTYTSRPYYKQGQRYEDYQPAYRAGYEGYTRHAQTGKTYDEVEPELATQYQANPSGSQLNWDEARQASRDAWERLTWRSRFQDEDQYWQQNYSAQPYYEKDYTYEDYKPAYQTGYEAYSRYHTSGRTYDEIEPELQRDYERSYGNGKLGWQKAKQAVKDAWHRAENNLRSR